MEGVGYKNGAGLEWMQEPLVIKVYGGSQPTPTVHLQLVPVFFNPREFCQNIATVTCPATQKVGLCDTVQFDEEWLKAMLLLEKHPTSREQENPSPTSGPKAGSYMTTE